MKQMILLLSFLSLPLFAAQDIELEVTVRGFEPKEVVVKPGTDVTLVITRKTDATCSKKVQIPTKNILKDLPLNQKVEIPLGKVEKGEIKFGCDMDMMDSALILVK